MKLIRWSAGLLIVVAFVAADIAVPMSMAMRWFFILSFGCLAALVRLCLGPSAPDRVAATKILGIMFVGFCGILSVTARQHIFIDIAIAWAIQSFIGTLALAKYIEGRNLDD